MASGLTKRRGGVRRTISVGRGPDSADDVRRHFREQYPVLLDGALSPVSNQSLFLRQARDILADGAARRDLMPAAVLREALDAVRSTPNPTTKAGMTAAGPRRVRVWWDADLADPVEDVLSDLTRPRPVLRFFDITGLDPKSERWNDTFDIDISLADQGKWVDFWSPDRLYVVDIGFVHADGRFLRLARTNAAEIPRESRGDRNPETTVRANLKPRRRGPALPRPDAAASAWAEFGPDWPVRDIEAETTVHTLYRLFLNDGPRALRGLPALLRRDAETLRLLYQDRRRRARRKAADAAAANRASILVARLDTARPAAPSTLAYPPVVATLGGRPVSAARADDAFALPHALLRAAREERRPRPGLALPMAVGGPKLGEPARIGRVATKFGKFARPLPPELEPASTPAAAARSVFEAAKTLRDHLAGLPAIRLDDRPKAAGPAPAPLRRFGGSEGKRLEKAGVRISRMALTLEGRTRPGARLKIAGKPVQADADGFFRLECLLAERASRIPVEAGKNTKTCINVEWETCGGRAGRKIKAAAGAR